MSQSYKCILPLHYNGRTADDKNMSRGWSIRICGDFKVTVNPILQFDQYLLPIAEDIFASLAGRQEFSKITLANEYRQILVTPESCKCLNITNQQTANVTVNLTVDYLWDTA